MILNRILEFAPSHEEALVSRILIMVHKAVDDHFPSAIEANRRFTKTALSLHDADGPPLPDHLKDADGGPGGANPSKANGPTTADAPATAAQSQDSAAGAPRQSATTDGLGQPPSYITHLDPLASHVEENLAAQSNAQSKLETIRTRIPVDLGTRILLAALLAGLILLAYVILS